jgi:flagellar protein FlbD
MLNLGTETPVADTWLQMKRKIAVIFVTRLNGSKFYINPELIQTIESTPDTVITLSSNKKLIVKDSPEEIAERFIEYRRKTLAPFQVDSPAEQTSR